MSEWWTYGLSDFLMFSPQVYYRQLQFHNHAIWPAQLLNLFIGFGILYVLIRPGDRAWRLMVTLLGSQWMWIALWFFWERYASINWAAAYVAPFITAEGLMLILLGIFSRPPVKAVRRGAAEWAGLALFAAALILYPFAAPLMGRPWDTAELFGVTPDPTAIATLALLALADGRIRWLAMIIPALWCVISSLTLWTMGSGDFLLPAAGALVAICLAFSRASHDNGGRR